MQRAYVYNFLYQVCWAKTITVIITIGPMIADPVRNVTVRFLYAHAASILAYFAG